MKRVLLIAGWILVFSLLATGVVWAQGEEGTQAGSGQIAWLLAPLVAAATAIERIIEMIFNWYESVILNISRFPTQIKGYLGWARQEVQKFQEELLKKKDDAIALRQIEDKLEEARERLQEYLESSFYMSKKRTLSLVLGIVLGLIIAFTTRLQMFGLLGIDLRWGWIDMLVTGLVIGTGSAPVHSLIGILQNTKDAVDQARALWSGRAITEVQDAYVKLLKETRGPAVAAAPTMAAAPAVAAEEMMMGAEEMVSGELVRLERAEEAVEGVLPIDDRAIRRHVKGMLR
jgi:molybdopterin converting factor small subunit